MLNLEFGEVKFFNTSELYGFLDVLDENQNRTGEKVFFHFNDGEWVEIVEGDIAFIGHFFGDKREEIYEPKEGARIMFQRAAGTQGRVKATPWTYTKAYINRAWQLFQPNYRIVEVVTLKQTGRSTERIIWQGQGSEEMSRLFPIQVINGCLNDPLYDETDETCTVRFRFDIWTFRDDASPNPFYSNLIVDGCWQECLDPRDCPPEALALKLGLSR